MLRFNKKSNGDNGNDDGPEDAGRRTFLRGAPAVAATAATGGAGEVVKVAGIGGQLGALTELANRVPKSEAGQQRMRRVLTGEPAWRTIEGKTDRWNETAGKIDFLSEKRLMDAVKAVSSDRPLADMLSDDVLSVTFGTEDLGQTEKLRSLRRFLQPILNESTTAANLETGMQGFFGKLADHAVKSPKDFQVYNGDGLYSQIEWLEEAVSYFDPDHPALIDIGDVIDEHRKFGETTFKKRQIEWQIAQDEEAREIQKERDARNRENAEVKQEQLKQEAQAEIEDKKTNFDARETYPVTIKYLGGTRFLALQDETSERLPTRMDWLQFLQGYDEDNKTALRLEMSAQDVRHVDAINGEIELSERATKFVLEQFGNRNFAYIDIPNRRTGADLHEWHYQPEECEFEPEGKPTFRPESHGISNPTREQRGAALDEWRGIQDPQQELDL